MKIFRLLFISFCLIGAFSCKNRSSLFEKISASHSGIYFNNTITESDSMNPMAIVNIYNGGGVGIGDFNNDGLPDIYFTGNMVPCKLYLNKGDFKFDDITDKAGVAGMSRWARSAAIVDINNDGLMDMYICNTIYPDSVRRTNILYVNQGLDAAGIPHFKNMADEYGLAIREQSTMANFFDYDNDGDLDMYLTVNAASSDNENKFGKGTNPANRSTKGRLYRNNSDSLQHPFFQDVSVAAGIMLDGFGYGPHVADINREGWKDIYVTDDFLSDNILYINNHNGTFTNRSKEYFKHTSFNAMGQDIIDVNNDGLSDVIELDMNPKDNYRKKMMLGSTSYNAFQNFELYGNQYQYVRNTLQINQGPRITEGDTVGAPVFSEIAFMSGVAQTDWSWTPLVQDFDNDGYRDMIVTNGFPRDVTDHDFIAYRQHSVGGETPLQMMKKIPEVKLAKYAFKNTDGVSFNDVTDTWGLGTPGFSNGAAYADLDGDGDMDFVINNINDEAFVYRNNLRNAKDTTAHYLQVKCIGNTQNINGIGTWIDIYYDGNKHQAFENTPYRGYLSTDQCIAHFGLGKTTLIDSVVIRWPQGKKQILKKIAADQVLKVNVKDATETYEWQPEKLTTAPLFEEITKAAGINYTSKDIDFADFNIQTTLPHKVSEYCPALAAGDVDGNGLDDILIAGSYYNGPTLFLQQADARFTQRKMLATEEETQWNARDEGVLLFDANGDGSLDVYIASGGYKYKSGSTNYQDRLYLNNGKGAFKRDSAALPINHTSKLCVKSIDYNRDGKPDLFVSGRVEPWQYPKPVSSFIFRNDTKNGQVKFTDVTAEVAPDLLHIGMVCDALFTDFDNDNQLDLVLTGEWMPVTFLKNTNGKFKNITSTTGISGQTGLWNSIVAGDFRHTGRNDYIVGNIGLNTLYQASEEHPVYITAKDFENNGGYVAIPSLFLPDTKGGLSEFPAVGRDEIIDRIPSLKKRYDTYKPFATATMSDIFPAAMMKDAQRLKANTLQSCYIRNDGGGKFTMIPLPKAAQVSALNGMIADDFDGDGNLDVLMNGNDYGTEVSIGRFDALNGLLLKGDGKGSFQPLSILQSGVYIPGNGKALVKLAYGKGKYLVAGSQYKDALKVFQLRRPVKTIGLHPTDQYAIIQYKNGTAEKKEFYYGTSFLSQSARFINVDSTMANLVITSTIGQSRQVVIQK